MEYECDKASRDRNYLNIVVIYIAKRVDKSRCPSSLANTGKHLPLYFTGEDGKTYYNIAEITDAILGE